MTRLAWWWRRHMAAHREHVAWVAYRRWPDPANQRRLEDYGRELQRIDAARP